MSNETNEPRDAAEDDDMLCGLTADERDVLSRGLRALPETMPPRVVWERIRAQGEAEGLLRATGRRRWLAGAGLAATVAVAAMLVWRLDGGDGSPGLPDTPAAVVQDTPGQPVTALHALMVESRQLENDLRQLPAEPRVMRAGTALTISDLEDRIAAIDYQLNEPGVVMTDEEREIFWRERVRLMKSLVRLRYAQAQRTAF